MGVGQGWASPVPVCTVLLLGGVIRRVVNLPSLCSTQGGADGGGVGDPFPCPKAGARTGPVRWSDVLGPAPLLSISFVHRAELAAFQLP